MQRPPNSSARPSEFHLLVTRLREMSARGGKITMWAWVCENGRESEQSHRDEIKVIIDQPTDSPGMGRGAPRTILSKYQSI